MLDYLKKVISKEAILNWIKKWIIEFAFRKILGSAIVGGVKGWLIKYGINWLWKQYLGPGLRYLFRKVEMLIRKRDNKKNIGKLNKAKNEKEFDDAFDNLK